MYKSCGIQVRLSGKTHEEFVDHWVNVHAAKSDGVGPDEGLFGYVANEVIGFITPKDLPKLDILEEVDGIAQMWFDQKEGLHALAQYPTVQQWFKDGPNYCGNRVGLILEENVIKNPGITPRAHAKVFMFLQLKDEEGFSALDKAVRALQEMPCVEGLCVSAVVAANASVNMPSFELPRIDVVVEMWCHHMTGYKRAMASDEGNEFMKVLASHYNSISIIETREIVFKPPSF